MIATRIRRAAMFPPEHADPLACLRAALHRLRAPFGQVFTSGAMTPEMSVCHIGAVEIRATVKGWALETSVKGELSAARTTGLARIAGCLVHRRVGASQLHTARPLMQTQVAPGLWRLQVPLAALPPDVFACAPARGRVRLRPTGAVMVAVLRVRGRPTAARVEEADARLRQALSRTTWATDGGPIIRLYRCPAWLPPLRGFELAVPVVAVAGP